MIQMTIAMIAASTTTATTTIETMEEEINHQQEEHFPRRSSRSTLPLKERIALFECCQVSLHSTSSFPTTSSINSTARTTTTTTTVRGRGGRQHQPPRQRSKSLDGMTRSRDGISPLLKERIAVFNSQSKCGDGLLSHSLHNPIERTTYGKFNIINKKQRQQQQQQQRRRHVLREDWSVTEAPRAAAAVAVTDDNSCPLGTTTATKMMGSVGKLDIVWPPTKRMIDLMKRQQRQSTTTLCNRHPHHNKVKQIQTTLLLHHHHHNQLRCCCDPSNTINKDAMMEMMKTKLNGSITSNEWTGTWTYNSSSSCADNEEEYKTSNIESGNWIYGIIMDDDEPSASSASTSSFWGCICDDINDGSDNDDVHGNWIYSSCDECGNNGEEQVIDEAWGSRTPTTIEQQEDVEGVDTDSINGQWVYGCCDGEDNDGEDVDDRFIAVNDTTETFKVHWSSPDLTEKEAMTDSRTSLGSEATATTTTTAVLTEPSVGNVHEEDDGIEEDYEEEGRNHPKFVSITLTVPFDLTTLKNKKKTKTDEKSPRCGLFGLLDPPPRKYFD